MLRENLEGPEINLAARHERHPTVACDPNDAITIWQSRGRREKRLYMLKSKTNSTQAATYKRPLVFPSLKSTRNQGWWTWSLSAMWDPRLQGQKPEIKVTGVQGILQNRHWQLQGVRDLSKAPAERTASVQFRILVCKWTHTHHSKAKTGKVWSQDNLSSNPCLTIYNLCDAG